MIHRMQQTAGDVCYQINFQVVKGPRYSFPDVSRATGSNATVKTIMETLRTNAVIGERVARSAG